MFDKCLGTGNGGRRTMIQSHFNSLAENSWKAIELRHARRRQFNYLSLGFYLFFLSFCLSSPTIDVDFIDCKKNPVRLLQLRGDDEKLPYWEIKYSMMQSERQHRKNLFIDILFYLSWLWFIFSTSLSYYASIHSRWISLLGYLMRFYAKEWNSCADF